MLQLPGYVITKQIEETDHERLYTGYVDDTEKRPCLIKSVRLNNPSASNLAQVKQTYKTLQNLSSPYHLAIEGFQQREDLLVIVFEETKLITLRTYLAQKKIALEPFFKIGIALANALQTIHQNNMTHGGLQPSNILIHDSAEQLKLWNFGLTPLITPATTYYDPHCLNYTLPYISPEQTGRAHRITDYRTDFYSLGIIFYEMLAGHLPFVARDPLELIHNHLARTPQPLSNLLPEIPEIISDIVLRLLAKEPEDRYQSGKGLRVDLENCQQQFLKDGVITPFALGQYDQLSKFIIPQKLYGRNQEINLLKEALQSVKQGGTDIVFVSGEAGIGKSTLIKELRPAYSGEAYFVSGKYEQFKRNKAYNGILQAVQHFVRQIQNESSANIASWKTHLTTALGNNGPILTSLVPSIGRLLELPTESTTLTSLNPNQLHLLFEQLIKAIATPARPLIIFLDDLQWIDSASLDLIQYLILNASIKNTLFIATYRDKEIHTAHPLKTTIDALKNSDLPVHFINLHAMADEAVNQWLANTFTLEPDKTTDLTNLIYQKTGGNPFFVKLFLQTLYEESILFFDDQHGWQWNLQRGKQLQVTDNVVNLMIQRVNSLPAETQAILCLASCIGNQFDLDALSDMSTESIEDTYFHLEPAISAGMIIQATGNKFRFAHDRIQQAIYSLLEQKQKVQFHWQIGSYWLDRSQLDPQTQELFDIVDQLNLGHTAADAEPDYLDLITLNVDVGRKAKMSAAYQTAYDYLETAVTFAQFYEDGWGEHYEIWLDLYNEAAETAYLSGHLTEMEQVIPIVLHQAKTVLDKQTVIHIQIQVQLSQNQLPQAAAIGRDTLAELGVVLPENPTQDDFDHGYRHIQSLIEGRNIETLVESSPMQDRKSLMAMQILSAISTAVWAMSPILYAIDVFKRVELSLTHGNAPTSAAAYAGFGVILCSQMGDVRTGYRFGQLALEIVEKYQVTSQKSRTIGTAYCFTFHWRKHLRDSLPHFLEGHQAGIEVGDFSFAASNGYLYARHGYFSGQSLTHLKQRIRSIMETAQQLKQARAVIVLNMYYQICENLQSDPANPYQLAGAFFDEDETIALYQSTQDRNRLITLYCNKLILAYLFGAYEDAAELAAQVKKGVEGLSASIYLPVFTFYDSLITLERYKTDPSPQQEKRLTRVTNNQKNLLYWAQNAPMNFRHKWLLVEAEYAVVTQNHGQARENYDKAIQLANQNGYIQEEGLANELAAKFYISRGQIGLAKFYGNAAMACYGRWGATSKVNQLKQIYPHLFQFDEQPPGFLPTPIAEENVLDYATVLKATRILSEELILEQLLEKLMRVIIENAGAQSGYLMLLRNDQLKIEATITVDADKIDVFMAEPITDSKELAISVVQHVMNMKESILLHHAAKEGDFTEDPNVVAKQTKSVLCMPIQRQTELLGILYLENNLSTHAFTKARIDLLQTLLGQAAISLQNAIYYENLKQEIEERKDAEDRLRASEAEWRSLVDNVPDAILIVDRDMNVRFVNRLLPPLRQEDVIGKPVYHFVAPEDQATVKEQVAFVFAHGEITEYETSGPGQDGKMAWYSTRVGPISHNGEIVAVLMIATDISTRREAQEKLQLYMSELERSNRELQEFAYVSSHDLQEPLRKIQTFGDRLEVKYANILDARGLDYLKRMQNAAARMQTLIEDLLAFSRVSTQAKPFKLVHLDEVVQDVLLNLEVQIALVNGRIHFDPLHQIEADRSQMLQLLQNIISNALKFHRPNIPPVVSIKSQLMLDSSLGVPAVQITVKDNGIGFDKQYEERVFGVFQRLHGREAYEGTGVGLAICRKITDRHHGTISVSSVVGQGTAFHILLPVSQTDVVDS